MTEETEVDKIILWLKKKKGIAIIIAIGIIIIAIGNFTGALQNIKSFLFPSEVPEPVITVQFPDKEPKKCEFDILPKKPFKYKNSTKILLAVFEGATAKAKEFGAEISLSIADRLDEYSKDSLYLGVKDIELYRLNCFIQSHSQARDILDSLGANIVIWGNNFCALSSEEARFCPKATLTKRISPLEARGERIAVKEQLAITDLDLPSLTAEKPYLLLNFIFGLHFFLRDKFKQAGECFEKAGDEIYRDEKGIEYVYHYLGYTYRFLSKNDKALRYYEKSLKLFEESGNRRGEGVSLNNIAGVYYARGKYDEAIEYYKRSLKIKEEIGDHQGEGVSLNNIAGVYYARGKYDATIEYFNKSLKIFGDIGNRKNEGVSLNNIGMVYKAWGKYEQALEYYKRSLKICEDIGDRKNEGVSLNNIGWVYKAWGKYDQAIEYYKKSLKIREEVGDRQGEGVTLNNIGMIYKSWGKYEEALKYYQRSLKILEDIGAAEAKTVKENIEFLKSEMQKKKKE